jgi:hypothetical protein
MMTDSHSQVKQLTLRRLNLDGSMSFKSISEDDETDNESIASK